MNHETEVKAVQRKAILDKGVQKRREKQEQDKTANASACLCLFEVCVVLAPGC